MTGDVVWYDLRDCTGKGAFVREVTEWPKTARQVVTVLLAHLHP